MVKLLTLKTLILFTLTCSFISYNNINYYIIIIIMLTYCSCLNISFSQDIQTILYLLSLIKLMVIIVIILTNTNTNNKDHNSKNRSYYFFIRSSSCRGSRSTHDIYKQGTIGQPRIQITLLYFIIFTHGLLIEVVGITLLLTEDELETFPVILISVNITAGLEHVLLP